MTETKPPYTVIGTPFSTFTRTITLGLQYKGLRYTQISTPPQTETAFSGHPFGYLPTLIIHRQHEGAGKADIRLRESQAIVRYIDRLAPEPSLHLHMWKDVVEVEEKMWEFVSFAASFGFPMIEATVIKPRVKALDEGKLTEHEIRAQIRSGIAEMKQYLKVAESLMAPEGYVFGDTLTWADFFLYPLMADLRMVPEWEVVTDRLKAWTEKMDQLPAAQATKAGTLSVGARP